MACYNPQVYPPLPPSHFSTSRLKQTKFSFTALTQSLHAPFTDNFDQIVTDQLKLNLSEKMHFLYMQRGPSVVVKKMGPDSPAPRPCRFRPLPAKLPVVMSQLRMRWLTIVQNRNSAIVPPSRKHDISFFSFFCFIFPNP